MPDHDLSPKTVSIGASIILYHSADLLWGTRIKAEAAAADIAARPVRDHAMLAARLADSTVRGLIVDLDAPDIALALIRQLREHEANTGAARIPVLAFGPHVEVERFAQAKAAGADAAIARGAFANRMVELMRGMLRG